jgi:hypothetical protein
LPATKPKNHILEALHISDRALLPQLYQSLGSTAGGLTVQLGSRFSSVGWDTFADTAYAGGQLLSALRNCCQCD